MWVEWRALEGMVHSNLSCTHYCLTRVALQQLQHRLRVQRMLQLWTLPDYSSSFEVVQAAKRTPTLCGETLIQISISIHRTAHSSLCLFPCPGHGSLICSDPWLPTCRMWP